MQRLIFLCLANGFSGIAMAHELAGSEGHMQQLLHQVLSLHHLPALVLLAICGLVLYRIATRRTD